MVKYPAEGKAGKDHTGEGKDLVNSVFLLAFFQAPKDYLMEEYFPGVKQSDPKMSQSANEPK